MSLLRSCQFCPKRLRGVIPGAMTILLDGHSLDSAIVLCTEHAIDVRRVLDGLRQRSIVAQRAREVDVTATAEHAPVSAQQTALYPIVVPVPEPVERAARRRRTLASLRPVWRGERPY